MDIRGLNPTKRKIEWILRTFAHFYNARHKDSLKMMVANSGNPVIKKLYAISNEVCGDIGDHKYFKQNEYKDVDRYRRLLLQPMEFALTVYSTDSAWKDIGNVMLYKILMAKDELMPILEKEVKDPKHWYYNIWESFQEETVDMQNKGDLPKGIVSDSESYLVDGVTKERIRSINEKEKKQQKENDHW